MTYHVGTSVGLWEHVAGVRCGHDKVGDDRNRLDFRCPVEFAVVTNAQWWLWRLNASVDSSGGGGEHLTQRDLFARHIFRLELVEVGTDETTKQRGGNIVRMPFCKAMPLG